MRKVRLTRNLPLEDKHGAFEGRVFDCFRYDSSGRGRKAWFVGDAGEECAAYLASECELLDAQHPGDKEPSDD